MRKTAAQESPEIGDDIVSQSTLSHLPLVEAARGEDIRQTESDVVSAAMSKAMWK